MSFISAVPATVEELVTYKMGEIGREKLVGELDCSQKIVSPMHTNELHGFSRTFRVDELYSSLFQKF